MYSLPSLASVFFVLLCFVFVFCFWNIYMDVANNQPLGRLFGGHEAICICSARFLSLHKRNSHHSLCFSWEHSPYLQIHVDICFHKSVKIHLWAPSYPIHSVSSCAGYMFVYRHTYTHSHTHLELPSNFNHKFPLNHINKCISIFIH